MSKHTKTREAIIRKLLDEDGGKDGMRTSVVRTRLSTGRTGRQVVRSKPGSFVWRYGRQMQDARFHAGSHLAQLWERAGIAVASSASFLRGVSSGYSTGISDGRVAALDKLRGFQDAVGMGSAARLVDYCVEGLTTGEIARKYGSRERDMAPVLDQDLRDCAAFFGFMGTAPKPNQLAR